MALNYTVALRNARLQAIATALNAGSGPGKIRIYDGTIPTNADTAVGAQVLLAELALSDPVEDTITGGVFNWDTITQDASADASGTASWFRALDSDNNAVLDGSVGTSGADLNLNSVSISAGGTVSVTSGQITAGNA